MYMICCSFCEVGMNSNSNQIRDSADKIWDPGILGLSWDLLHKSIFITHFFGEIIIYVIFCWVKKFLCFYLCCVCRFQLCASTCVCCAWEFKRSCSGPCFHCITYIGLYASTRSVSNRRTYSFSSACFHYHLLCRSLPSFFGYTKVINPSNKRWSL